MSLDTRRIDWSPATQGKAHPLQGEHEVFIGYFTERFFNAHITHASKRIVLDEPGNLSVDPDIRQITVDVRFKIKGKYWYVTVSSLISRFA